MLRFASYQNQRDRSPVVTLFFLPKWWLSSSSVVWNLEVNTPTDIWYTIISFTLLLRRTFPNKAEARSKKQIKKTQTHHAHHGQKVKKALNKTIKVNKTLWCLISHQRSALLAQCQKIHLAWIHVSDPSIATKKSPQDHPAQDHRYWCHYLPTSSWWLNHPCIWKKYYVVNVGSSLPGIGMKIQKKI